MATSARANSGNYDTLWTNTAELWANDNSFEDLVYVGTPLLGILRSQAQVKELPHTIAVRINESRFDGIDSYEYYDNVNTDPQKGTQAANCQVAQYAAPIALSDQEALEMDTPAKLADHMEYVMETAAEEMSQRLTKDVIAGNASNAKNMLGLFQVMPAFTHDQTNGSAATAITQALSQRFQTKQGTDTFMGITRAAWTNENTPGTYWEGNSFNFFDANFAYSSAAPNDAIKRLMDLRQLCTYGPDKPNIMVSSLRPFQDYKVAAMSTQQITRGSGMIDANVTFENVIFDGIPWFWDDAVKSYGDNASTADDDEILLINSKKTKLCIDSRQNFSLTDVRRPVDQMASVKHMIARLQLVSTNPRSSARGFAYGA